MSKQEQLKKVLVIGTTVSLIKHLVDGKEAKHVLSDRDQLITALNEKGIELIVAEPVNKGELGARKWDWPGEDSIVSVGLDHFEIKTGDDGYRWRYSLKLPEGIQPDLEQAPAGGQKAGRQRGQATEPASPATPAEASADPVVE